MSDIGTLEDYSLPIITPLSINSMGPETSAGAAATTGGGVTAHWLTANTAVYIPFRIGVTTTFQKMFWINTATVGSNSVDVGIYDSQTNQLWHSGSTATSGATQVQSVTISGGITLKPGIYYMAMAVNGITDTFALSSIGNTYAYDGAAMAGAQQQLSAFPLPTNSTQTDILVNQSWPILCLTVNTLI